jgi:hypothetical protein
MPFSDYMFLFSRAVEQASKDKQYLCDITTLVGFLPAHKPVYVYKDGKATIILSFSSQNFANYCNACRTTWHQRQVLQSAEP